MEKSSIKINENLIGFNPHWSKWSHYSHPVEKLQSSLEEQKP